MSNIPKVIYMCHKTLDKIKIYSQNWKILNPDYVIELYDDERCIDFFKKEYSQIYLDIFNFLQDGPIKSDFWRICVLNKYGGLYVDADIEPFVSLNEYIENDDYFVTCISSAFKKENLELQFNPHFIMSNKNNEILQNAIKKYIKTYENKTEYSYWRWSICIFLTIQGITEKKSQIIFLDNKKFKFLCEEKYSYCEYDGKIVLNNRYKNYNNHNFIE